MPLGNAYPVRSIIPDTKRVQGVWTGGGAAANCTQSSSDWSKGIASVNYNAATGKYKITFRDVGQQIVGGKIEVCRAAAAAPLLAVINRATFSIANKTVDFEVWDVDAGSALTDLATTDKLLIDIQFATRAPDA